MRAAWVTDKSTLRMRMTAKAQVDVSVPEAEMPAYMESFLGHLRLLVGVPFDYLIADARLLPDESIRFFYLDRSWTDRLVDGAIAVGKTGTREQAHHQAHAPAVQEQLDFTERGVRDLQRARVSFEFLRKNPRTGSGGTITGFLLRSAAVSGWPHMDVRAFDKVLPVPVDMNDARTHQLRTLRLERLAPSVLLALFEGIPKLVWCEEPHHGVMFGVHEVDGKFSIFRRDAQANKILGSQDISVPRRATNHRVLAVRDVQRNLQKARDDGQSEMPVQDGSADLAIELLQLPWRQRFQGSGGRPQFTGVGAFVPLVVVAPKITQEEMQLLVKGLVK
jgi:hypothetical protein